MPHFTAIALHRLLDSGDSQSVDKSGSNPSPIPYSQPLPNSMLERRNSTSITEHRVPRPLERRNSTSSTQRKVTRPQISPALYATPEITPIPDSPSSFPPAPFLINHKRRGPRLLKSSSKDDEFSQQKSVGEQKVKVTINALETKAVDSSDNVSVSFIFPDTIVEEHQNGVSDHDKGSSTEGFGDSNGSNDLATENDLLKRVAVTPERDSEAEDFFDPQESMSVMSSTEGEDNCGERSLKFITPRGEFFDAWEELSPEIGSQPCLRDIDAELRETRLNLLSEIEKRKQAEETLSNVQSQWQGIRDQLSLLGLTLPKDLTIVSDGEQLHVDPAEEACQQVYVARFVADSIGRGIARAEIEIEMEAQIETKNFEIARLVDRLHYYEGLNREMTQRNREAVDMARYQRQKRKRRQRWIWSSIATVIVLGSATLAWSYLSTENGSSLTSLEAQEADEQSVDQHQMEQ